jgi:hypothetical protein
MLGIKYVLDLNPSKQTRTRIRTDNTHTLHLPPIHIGSKKRAASLKKESAKHFPTDKLSRPKTKTMLGVRLVATLAVARARESRYRPRVGERGSSGDGARARRERAVSPRSRPRWSARPGERRARGRRERGTGGARARVRATWRDLTGPRVAI